MNLSYRSFIKFLLRPFTTYQRSLCYRKDVQQMISQFKDDFYFIPNAVTVGEEQALLKYLLSKFKKKKYENGHWDSVITKFKETEVAEDSDVIVNEILQRCKQSVIIATGKEYQFLPVHAIDLAQDGVISPHVDSVKFSGELIAGLSLVSTRILRLSPNINDSDSVKRLTELNYDLGKSYDIILPPHSIYIIKGLLRYHFTHAIIDNQINGDPTLRRVSLMFRDIKVNN